MMPFLWNWAAKSAVGSIPWKWIIIGAVALFIGAAGWYAVYSYRSEVAARVKAEQGQKEALDKLATMEAEKARMLHDIERMADYMANADHARLQAENKLRAVATRKVKRDEKGDIAPDDGLLADLRGLFPPASGADSVRADSTPGAAVPR